MITRSVFARGAASIILAGALLTATSGCVFLTPTATLNQYDPSDGIGANVGDVHLMNVLGVINEDGHAISLLVQMHNDGTDSAKVQFQFESGGKKTTISKTVGAGQTVSFGAESDEEQIIILNPGVPAGDLIPVYVQYGDNEGTQLMVPVLNATGPYSELAPPEILRDGK